MTVKKQKTRLDKRDFFFNQLNSFAMKQVRIIEDELMRIILTFLTIFLFWSIGNAQPCQIEGLLFESDKAKDFLSLSWGESSISRDLKVEFVFRDSLETKYLNWTFKEPILKRSLNSITTESGEYVFRFNTLCEICQIEVRKDGKTQRIYKDSSKPCGYSTPSVVKRL